MRLGVASDHAGYRYKARVAEHLRAMGHEVRDFGTGSEVPVDYPDLVRPLALAVAGSELELGIAFGGSGNGEAIAANRVPGIRCAVCWNEESARLSRAHNDANMLSLGQRLVPEASLLRIVDVWLETPFEGGRHIRRIRKLDGGEEMVEMPPGVEEELSRREIVTTRELAARPELVFRAFHDPDRLARWWGPKGFTNTFLEFDPRPGGRWRFNMHGPDGSSHPNESVFVEFLEPRRIVFRHLSGPRFEMTITLAEHGGGTRLAWRMLFDTALECARVKAFAVEANEQNLDRLEAELAASLLPRRAD
jgi:ribose 5-phosphate isomerase B